MPSRVTDTLCSCYSVLKFLCIAPATHAVCSCGNNFFLSARLTVCAVHGFSFRVLADKLSTATRNLQEYLGA